MLPENTTIGQAVQYLLDQPGLIPAEWSDDDRWYHAAYVVIHFLRTDAYEGEDAYAKLAAAADLEIGDDVRADIEIFARQPKLTWPDWPIFSQQPDDSSAEEPPAEESSWSDPGEPPPYTGLFSIEEVPAPAESPTVPLESDSMVEAERVLESVLADFDCERIKHCSQKRTRKTESGSRTEWRLMPQEDEIRIVEHGGNFYILYPSFYKGDEAVRVRAHRDLIIRHEGNYYLAGGLTKVEALQRVLGERRQAFYMSYAARQKTGDVSGLLDEPIRAVFGEQIDPGSLRKIRAALLRGRSIKQVRRREVQKAEKLHEAPPSDIELVDPASPLAEEVVEGVEQIDLSLPPEAERALGHQQAAESAEPEPPIASPQPVEEPAARQPVEVTPPVEQGVASPHLPEEELPSAAVPPAEPRVDPTVHIHVHLPEGGEWGPGQEDERMLAVMAGLREAFPDDSIAELMERAEYVAATW